MADINWLQRSESHLLPLSVEKSDFLKAKKEWVYVGLFDNEEADFDCQLCGHKEIRYEGSVAKFKIKIIFPNNSIIYAGIPKSTLISMQTEKPKRVPSFRLFLYKPRIASMPLIVVEAVRKL